MAHAGRRINLQDRSPRMWWRRTLPWRPTPLSCRVCVVRKAKQNQRSRRFVLQSNISLAEGSAARQTSSAEALKLAVTSFPKRSIIGRTFHTEVRKVHRKGTTVAIKLCRKPDSKQSADMWRNELDILYPLDHVGQQPIEDTLTELTSPAVCCEAA